MRTILITSDSIWPPHVYNTGMTAIYNMILELSEKNEVYVLTFIQNETDRDYLNWRSGIEEEYGNIKFLFVNNSIKKYPKLFFYIQKIILIFFVYKYNKKYNFDSILEISSAPIMIRRTSLYKYFTKAKLYHYIAVVNNGFMGQASLIGGKIDKVFCATKILKNCLEKINTNNFIYLPTPVKINKFIANDKKESNQINILYMGIIDERKGIDVYVKMVKYIIDNYKEKLENVKFNIVTRERGGNFYNFEKKRDFIFTYLKGYEDHFIFQEKTVDTNQVFQDSDLVLFPITNMHGILGYPLTILECISSETMFFATNLDEIREFSDEKVLFEKDNYEELSNKIIDFLDNKDKYKSLLLDMKKNIINNFDLVNIVKKLNKELI